MVILPILSETRAPKPSSAKPPVMESDRPIEEVAAQRAQPRERMLFVGAASRL
jgi:hypothetical protein